jgi:hypothetical protein
VVASDHQRLGGVRLGVGQRAAMQAEQLSGRAPLRRRFALAAGSPRAWPQPTRPSPRSARVDQAELERISAAIDRAESRQAAAATPPERRGAAGLRHRRAARRDRTVWTWHRAALAHGDLPVHVFC